MNYIIYFFILQLTFIVSVGKTLQSKAILFGSRKQGKRYLWTVGINVYILFYSYLSSATICNKCPAKCGRPQMEKLVYMRDICSHGTSAEHNYQPVTSHAVLWADEINCLWKWARCESKLHTSTHVWTQKKEIELLSKCFFSTYVVPVFARVVRWLRRAVWSRYISLPCLRFSLGIWERLMCFWWRPRVLMVITLLSLTLIISCLRGAITEASTSNSAELK